MPIDPRYLDFLVILKTDLPTTDLPTNKNTQIKRPDKVIGDFCPRVWAPGLTLTV